MPAPPNRTDDAALNRAVEGIAAIEDMLRSHIHNPDLAETAKTLRGDLVAAVRGRPPAAPRVGRESSLPSSPSPPPDQGPIRDVGSDAAAEATFRRGEEALRGLEDATRPLDPPVAESIRGIRQRAELLKQATLANRRLGQATLQVLVDCRQTQDAFAEVVTAMIQAGVGAIQLRDKTADDRTLLARARILASHCRRGPTLSIINDRPDVAVIAGADAVHVGQDELPVADVRTLVGNGMLIGVSTHSILQAREAVARGANYLGVGPVHPSRTKRFAEFPGLELVARVANEISIPWYAIGGIDRTNLGAVLEEGARRVAVQRAVVGQGDVGQAVAALLEPLAAYNSTPIPERVAESRESPQPHRSS